MKLNPPASSSDLDSAREIAKRLHLRRRADEPARPAAAAPLAPSPLLSPTATPRAAAAAPPPAKAPVPPPATPPVRPAAAPALPVASPPQTFQPPAFEPPPVPAARPSPPPVPQPASRPAAKAEPVRPRTAAPPPAAPAPPAAWREDALDSLTPPGLPAIEALGGPGEGPAGIGSIGVEADDGSIVIEETDASIEDIVNSAGLPAIEEAGPPAAETTTEDVLQEVVDYEAPAASDSALDEVAAPSLPFEDEPTPPDVVSEELFDMPPPPSWGDIADTCMGLGHARGAMLINPSGEVFATRGQWPDPGANAIASKLVAMMEKTLKDAPTRSVSAPLGGLHLTAWRVPLAEGLVTAAFIADAPLRADLRAPIDAQILSGEGL